MRKKASPVCVLVSGGLDSAALIYGLLKQGKRVLPLYVRCGLRWEKVELYWLRRFLRVLGRAELETLQVVSLPLESVYGNHWSVSGGRVPGAKSQDAAMYLPGRNILLTSLAAVVCAQRKIPALALGVLEGNPFEDAAPRFLKRMAACLSLGLGRPVHIQAPFRHLSKAAVIRRAAQAPWHLTFSCADPRGKRHCGKCNKCAERRRAFQAAGIQDPTRYVTYP